MSADAPRLVVTALAGLAEIRPGDDLARALGDAVENHLEAAATTLAVGDVLVVAQKIVSKAEGRYVDLGAVDPSPDAIDLARRAEKDPRLVELILRESVAVVRHRPGVLIVETRIGIVMANAGIDRSNVDSGAGDEPVLLLPVDPDASAARLRLALGERFGSAPAVVISDSVGRAWRNGTAALAIGAAGLPALEDLRGTPDRGGRPLEVSLVGLADQIASAAALVIGEAGEGLPAALVSGVAWRGDAVPASALLRQRELDLFR